MTNLKMFYAEVAPATSFKALVFSFWEFSVTGVDNDEPLIHEVFPDGCVSLCFYKNAKLNRTFLFVSELSVESSQIPIATGDIYRGMRLSPAACFAFLGLPPETLKTQAAFLIPRLSPYAENLQTALNACDNLAQTIEIFENLLEQMDFEKSKLDEKILLAVQVIENSLSDVKISSVAAVVGLSTRQLERRFRRSAGLSPKQYVRARRIRRTAVDLVNSRFASWAQRAAEMGFTDQSHLSHEISAITKRTPLSFANQVLRIQHGELVE